MVSTVYSFTLRSGEGINIVPLAKQWGSPNQTLATYTNVNSLMSDLQLDLKLWKKHERASNNMNFSEHLQDLIRALTGIFKHMQDIFDQNDSQPLAFSFKNVINTFFEINSPTYSESATIKLGMPLLSANPNNSDKILGGYDLLKNDENSFWKFLDIIIGRLDLRDAFTNITNDAYTLRAVAAFFKVQILGKSPSADKQVAEALDELKASREQTHIDLNTTIESFQMMVQNVQHDFKTNRSETKKSFSEDIDAVKQELRTCLVSAESGRIVENRLRSLSCQIIQAIFLERNLR
ncbi:hypothetical protein [Lacticaseibacillus paracasei]|uniref:hypothetical protein n=1 Tax=Lacticaseibacillus paracasei TaxID=1597 RepID=UPI003D08973D